jgi:Fe-S oxidoreductase
VSICLLGLPVKNVILVQVSDPQIAARLRMDEITDGIADAGLVAQHEQVVALLNERHQHTLERMMQELSKELPSNVDELITHLSGCESCRTALQECPIYGLEAAPGSGAISREAAIRWLVSCVSCGMCEQAVPDHLPLPAVIQHINQQSQGELVTV